MPFLFKVNNTSPPITETWGERPADDYNSRTEDSYINGNSATSNYANDQALVLGRAPSFGPWGRGLIRFTPNQDINGATITSATINLYCYAKTGAHEVFAYRVLQNWVESEVTWNIYSTGNNWHSAGCSAAHDTGVDDDPNYDRHVTSLDSQIVSVDSWISLDVTNLVQGWANGSIKEYGVLLMTSNEVYGNYLSLASSNHATNTTRPYLEITYTL